MANYFSNHSQSRFLANSSSPTTTQQAQQPPPPRSRLPTSKHFSTSVTTNSVSERSVSKEKVTSSNGSSVNGSASVHPLRNTYVRNLPPRMRFRVLTFVCRWVFWFRQQRAPGNKIASYEEGIKKISAFSSVRPSHSVKSLATDRRTGRVLLVSMDTLVSAVVLATHDRLPAVPQRHTTACLGRSVKSDRRQMDNTTKEGRGGPDLGGSRPGNYRRPVRCVSSLGGCGEECRGV